MRHLLIAAILIFTSTNLFATTYYVKTNGNDAADGLSHATAWKTIKKVNSFSFETGDDVYFLSGLKWQMEALTVDWNGTAANRTIVGSYFMKNGKETIGVSAGKNRPTLYGSYTGACSGTAGSCINIPKAVPPRAYGGMITIAADYVTIENLGVQNSAGRGIVLNNKNHHATLDNNKIYYTAGNSVIFSRNSSYNIMKNNDTSLCAVGWKNGDWVAVSKTWPTCNSAVLSHHNIFENNYIHESYGEGIVLLENSHSSIVRNNTIAAVRSANIYLDNGNNNIVENNIIIGDRDGEFARGALADGHRYGGGISVKVESYPKMYDSTNNIVRNNIMVRSLGLLMGLEADAEAAGKKIGVKFLNNTLVETGFYVQLNDGAEFYDNGTEIANNVFHGSPQTDTACKITPSSRVTIHHNHWTVAPSHVNCVDSIGGIVGDPRLNRTNWDAVSANNIPGVDDFKLKQDSTAIGAGKIQSTKITLTNFDHINKLSGNCDFDFTESSIDFNCGVRTSNTDMGALIYKPINLVSTPLPPTGVRLN